MSPVPPIRQPSAGQSSARRHAQAAQRLASDPALSAWVGASAGSGKTKVLTDRVLRLLLREGAEPGRILCLTFTKAAAAEMATRLARRLGAWATAPEAELRRDILELTGRAPGAAETTVARQLFCRVLEQPGGMRISTIHAFCQSLLRSFPLEADLPPQFALMEEADSDALLSEAREAVLSGRPGGGHASAQAGLEELSRLVSADDLAGAVRELARRRDRMRDPPAMARALAGALELSEDEDEDSLAARMAEPPEGVRAAARLLLEHKTKTARDDGARMLDWLGGDDGARRAGLGRWWDALHTLKGELRKSLRGIEAIEAEAVRQAALRERVRALRLRGATAALLALAGPVLGDYAGRKRRLGALDFDDLIDRARRLLRDPGSAWVLFKLDGGLDHLLLDEAQDTNPTQWELTWALTEEFFAGAGQDRTPPRVPDRVPDRIPDRAPPRGPEARSLFVVGDEKQSIYRFQGADPAGFGAWQPRYGERVARGGGRFEPVALDVSFRSCAPVLALVDAVFAPGRPAAPGVARPGAALRHLADRAGQAGLVEIWPPLARHEARKPEDWVVPDEPVSAQDADAQLAEALAARIAAMVGRETLPARGGRAIRPGDVMVLVRRRTRLLPLLVRQLKRRGVPVGGVDRIRLVEQIAVRDLLALCDVVLLPEDDLSLAAFLRSPLGGLSEDELFALCHRRGGRLWHGLIQERGRDTPAGRAAGFLAGLMDRADLITPHALLSEVLGEHGGRARLLARLGAEASDALDELLGAALRHEARHPPSLQGFVHWLRRGGAEVKREAENAGDAVRIMTAHGAKGLQAPIVVLPDVGPGGGRPTLLWDGEVPLWAPRREFHTPAFERARAARAEAESEEENRLLYVALTRAEDRLLVCGVEPKRADAARPGWHALVRDALRAMPEGGDGLDAVQEVAFDPAGFGAPAGTGFVGPLLRLSCAQTAEPVPEPPVLHPEDVALPAWVHSPAPAEGGADPVAPSHLPGEGSPVAAPHGQADPTGRRFRRGLLIHALLQILPDHPVAGRESVARRYLARPGHALTPEEQAETLAEIVAVLRHPALSDAFGPGSLAEAPRAGVVGGVRIAGQVDRLLVPDDPAAPILVLDYKTNRPPPERVEDVPPVYLRQMAAYRAVLRAAWPGRAIRCALVWTWAGRVMELPEEEGAAEPAG